MFPFECSRRTEPHEIIGSMYLNSDAHTRRDNAYRQLLSSRLCLSMSGRTHTHTFVEQVEQIRLILIYHGFGENGKKQSISVGSFGFRSFSELVLCSNNKTKNVD